MPAANVCHTGCCCNIPNSVLNKLSIRSQPACCCKASLPAAQAVPIAGPSAAAVCAVLVCASEGAAHSEQAHPCLAFLPVPAAVPGRLHHQLHCLHIVSPSQLPCLSAVDHVCNDNGLCFNCFACLSLLTFFCLVERAPAVSKQGESLHRRLLLLSYA